MTTTTIPQIDAATASILTPELAAFAEELREAGFSTYVFRSDADRVAKGGRESIATWLGFARDVDGTTCAGSVSRAGRWGEHSYSMPIKPSHEHGSSMFIGGDRLPEFPELSIGNAELYASPTGRNHLVGTQANHGLEAFERICVEVTR